MSLSSARYNGFSLTVEVAFTVVVLVDVIVTVAVLFFAPTAVLRSVEVIIWTEVGVTVARIKVLAFALS